jgi:hypothetical protein
MADSAAPHLITLQGENRVVIMSGPSTELSLGTQFMR